MRSVGAIAALLVIALPPRLAGAIPVVGDKLVIVTPKAGRPAKLVFVSTDAGLPFPVPHAAMTNGLRLEIFQPAYENGSMQGATLPHWKYREPPRERLVYDNPSAGEAEPSKVVVRRDARGTLFRWRSTHVGLGMTEPLGAVGVRIWYGGEGTMVCALFDAASIVQDRPGRFVAKGAPRPVSCFADPFTTTSTSVPGGSTTSTTFPPGECSGEDTLHVIQDRIFNRRGCATSTCHGAFNTSGLDLRSGSAYWSLIDVDASNPAAAAAGKKRVVPGDPEASFLSQKLRGSLTASEGVRMPSVGRVLTPVELALVDAWIAAGAPAEDVVPAAPCLPREVYEPAPALPVPAGGYQIVLTGPTLQPGEEEEGCLWVPTPNATDFSSGKWEFSLNPGTHHFAIFEWNKTWAPATGVWNANDFGCFSGAEFGNNISGSPQAPYYVDAYPAGVARVLGAGKYLGLNAHYYNEFDVPIQVKVWINVSPYTGPTPKIAKTIVDIDDTFNINLPPFTASVYPPLGAPRARWTNTSNTIWSVINLGGHMHHRGVRFTAWNAVGTKLYESFDWAHPNARYFTPTLDLPPGGYIDYECFYDNGVERPVRSNAYGQPMALTFGTSAEDAMCILTGQYFPH